MEWTFAIPSRQEEGNTVSDGRTAATELQVYRTHVEQMSAEMDKQRAYIAQQRVKIQGLEVKVKELEELHIMQLAAVSTATIQNTPSTITDRIGREHPYWTVAYVDTCRAVDREMKLIAKVSALEAILEKAPHAWTYSPGDTRHEDGCVKCAFEALKKGEAAK